MTATTRTGAGPRPGTKARIISAAENVVVRDGVARLTLESAAAEAGLSKGGVLYHYPTRDALVAAMVVKIIEEFDRDIESHLDGDGHPGAFTRAYIRASMEPTLRPEHENRLGAAVIAAAAAQPGLLVPLQRAADRWQARLEADGLDPALATVVRLACDGLWLCDLFGLAAVSGRRRADVASHLEGLVRAPVTP